MERHPLIRLNNGVAMPALGLGVYQSSTEDTVHAVTTALADGYRHIDTAAAYMNEQQVGEAVKASGIDRSEIFMTTKLWISDYGYDSALRACERSLRKLGMEYIDLYLLHQPVPMHFERTIAAYTAAETLLADGRVRAIGVSNFNEQQLEDLIAQTHVVPAVNQVEVHPFFTQQALRDTHTRLGIITQAWSPIGGVNRYWGSNAARFADPLKHPVIVELAAHYGKTPAQVILRWHIQNGVSAIPKSVNPNRIAENFAIFDFALTLEEMAAIEALDTGVRSGPDPASLDPDTIPFRIED
jgi:diketogulonate reductase-like aldo/keto reductase